MPGMHGNADPSLAHGQQSTEGAAHRWHQMPMINPYGWVPFVSSNMPHGQQQQQAMYGNGAAMAWQPMMHPALRTNGYTVGNSNPYSPGFANGDSMGGGAGMNYVDHRINGYTSHRPTQSPSPPSAFPQADMYDSNAASYQNTAPCCELQDPFRYQAGQPRRTPYATRWWDFVLAEFKWVDSPVGINLDVDQDEQDWPYDDTDIPSPPPPPQPPQPQPEQHPSPPPTYEDNVASQVTPDSVHGVAQPAWNGTTTAPARATGSQSRTVDTMSFATHEQAPQAAWAVPPHAPHYPSAFAPTQPRPPPCDNAHRVSRASHGRRNNGLAQTRPVRSRAPRSSLFNPIEDDDDDDEQASMEPTGVLDEEPAGGGAWHKRRRASAGSGSGSSDGSRSSTSSSGSNSGESHRSSRTTSTSGSSSDGANSETRSSDETEVGEVSTQGVGITMRDISVMRPSKAASSPATHRTTATTMPSMPYSLAMPDAELPSVFRPVGTRDVPRAALQQHPPRRSYAEAGGKKHSVRQDGQTRHSATHLSPTHHPITAEADDDDDDDDGEAGVNVGDKAGAAEYDVFVPDDEEEGGNAGRSSGEDIRSSSDSSSSSSSNTTDEENEGSESSCSDEEEGRRANAASTSSQYVLDFTMQEASVSEGLHNARGVLPPPPHQGIGPHTDPKPVPRLPVPRISTAGPTSSLEVDKGTLAAVSTAATTSKAAKKSTEAHTSRRQMSGSGVPPLSKTSLVAEDGRSHTMGGTANTDSGLRTRREYSIVPMIEDKCDGAVNDEEDKRHAGRDLGGAVMGRSPEASPSTSAAAIGLQAVPGEVTPWTTTTRFHRSSPAHDSRRRLYHDTANALPASPTPSSSAPVERQKSGREQQRRSEPDKPNTAHHGSVAESKKVHSEVIKLPSIAARLPSGATRSGSSLTKKTISKSGVATLPPTLTQRAASGLEAQRHSPTPVAALDARPDEPPQSMQTNSTSQDTNDRRTVVESAGAVEDVATETRRSTAEAKGDNKAPSTASSSTPYSTPHGTARRASTRLTPPARTKATTTSRQSVSTESTGRRGEARGRTPASLTPSSNAIRVRSVPVSLQDSPSSAPPSVPQQLEIERHKKDGTGAGKDEDRQVVEVAAKAAKQDYASAVTSQPLYQWSSATDRDSGNQVARPIEHAAKIQTANLPGDPKLIDDAKKGKALGKSNEGRISKGGGPQKVIDATVAVRTESQQPSYEPNDEKKNAAKATTRGTLTNSLSHEKKLQLRAKRATPSQNVRIVQSSNAPRNDIHETLASDSKIKRRTSKRQFGLSK